MEAGREQPASFSDCLDCLDTDPLSKLLQAIAGGDQLALSKFHGATFSLVAACSRAVLSMREDAEEVVSDVYLYVWRHAAAYNAKRGSVRTWLSVITRHRAIDRFRLGRATVSLDDEQQRELVATLAGPEGHVPNSLVNVHWSGAAYTAVCALTPLRRRLLNMAFDADLTHQEIAEILGMPLGTVKSHLRRAIGALRETVRPDA